MEMVWTWVCFLTLTQACSGSSHVMPGRASPPGPCCRTSLGLGPDKDSGVHLRHRETLASVFATWDIAFWGLGAHLRLMAEIRVEDGWLSLLSQPLPSLKTRKHFLIGNLKCSRGDGNGGRSSWLSRAWGICHPSCTPPQKQIAPIPCGQFVLSETLGQWQGPAAIKPSWGRTCYIASQAPLSLREGRVIQGLILLPRSIHVLRGLLLLSGQQIHRTPSTLDGVPGCCHVDTVPSTIR